MLCIGDAHFNALPFLIEAVYLNQTSSLALLHFQQATLSYGQACYVEAIQHYLAGLKLGAAQHHYIYADLAKAYEMVGQWDKALACLDIALRLCPDSPTTLRRKARILDEKACYDTLICADDFREPPPQEFLERLQEDPTTSPQWVVNSEFFDLTCHSPMKPQTVWNIYRLIHQTRAEIGEMLGGYPIAQVPISITNTNGMTVSERSLPKWASGYYDGGIHLAYCAAGEPVLSILYALLRHEWVHLLVHHLTQGHCPMWLNEGLAQNLARPMFQSERFALEHATEKKGLLSFSTLSESFSELPTKSRKLAYIQSAAIADFLIQQFGFPKIRELLYELRNGIQTKDAVEKVFERTLAEIPLAGAC
ncbi:MAG: tetratricopeptide repeat protein [Candidatus Poribacteria bacterium]|nr:tetratricopeptide repeat protein [Candidatus Poribacteria bacterium]MYK17349.1 tetratricopeptide repeat protein [Candidatus Poribacteria bacterium]